MRYIAADLIACQCEGAFVQHPPQLRLQPVLVGIPTEVIRQNLCHVDVKTTPDYIGVLDGSTRAPVSVYDASTVLAKLYVL